MHVNRVNWGLILIIFGLVALGWTTGHLPFEVIVRLVSLWPILLIAVGIQMIFCRSKAPQLAYFSTLLIAAAAIYAVMPYWHELKSEDARRSSGKLEQAIPTSIKGLEVDADFSYRDFTLSDYDQSGAELQFDRELLEPHLSFRERDNIGRLDITHRGDHWLRMFKEHEFALWKLKVTREYPLDLSLKSREAYCYLRMANLRINSLDLDCEKCTEVVLQFGASIPSRPVTLNLDNSKLHVEIPSRFGIVLKGAASLPSYQTRGLGFVRKGEDLVSDSIMRNDSLLILDLGPGLREILINRY